MQLAASHENIVIISGHPDDMEIGMGGTVAKLVELLFLQKLETLALQ